MEVRFVRGEGSVWPRVHIIEVTPPLFPEVTLCGHDTEKYSWTKQFWPFVDPPVLCFEICNNCIRSKRMEGVIAYVFETNTIVTDFTKAKRTPASTP